ncbi:udp-galactose transporter, putative, partial [Perkinsus marinus ATCC 50983]
MLIKDYDALKRNGFFFGYSTLTWTTIFLEAGGGLIVAVVIKYADTILKNFATAAAIISSTTISALFLGFEVRPSFVIGAVLVITAIYMYSAKPTE